jgi:drug/metabolite transporter (DMT)-like permease
MNSLAISLVLIAAVMHALRDTLTKNSSDKQIFVWWLSALSSLFFLPIVLFFLTKEGLSLNGFLFAMALGMVHFVYWVLYSKTYEHGEISHVYPIMRSAPALVLVFAVFLLGESVTTLGVSGILIITLGLFTLNLKKLSLHDLSEPFRSIRHEKSVRYAFLTMLLVATYSTLDKVGISLVHPFIYAFLISISALVPYSFYLSRTKTLQAFLEPIKLHRKKVLLAAFLATFNYPLVLLALEFSPVSYVTGFRQISVVFAVFFGGFLLKEKLTPSRIAGSFLIFIGSLLIALG